MTIQTMMGIKEILVQPITLAALAGLIAWAMMVADSKVSGEPKSVSTYIKNVTLVVSLVLGVVYLVAWLKISPDVMLGEPDF